MILPANKQLTAIPFIVDFKPLARTVAGLEHPNIVPVHEVGTTPAYMSPEQAKGEGHRVDGRSDIFSLGGHVL